eukprot:scaffold4493_cov205-Skeletonema_dohrnii-CCMP3373.AAC.1
MSAVSQPINQRKRSIIQANYNIGKSEEGNEVGEDNVLIHSVSCDFGYGADGGGLRRRKKKQRHEDSIANDADEESGDDEMTEVDASAAAAASVPSAAQKNKAAPPQTVVPLSMQLFRPFWSLSCCPDCDTDPMGKHHRRRMMQDDAFLMDGGGGASPPSAIDGGVLDARLRSVSMTSLKGTIGISSSSASSTITGDRLSSGIKLSSNRDLHINDKNAPEEHEEHEDVDEEEEDDISNRAAVANNNASSFLPSSSSSLESTTKLAPSSPSSSSSGILLDDLSPNNHSLRNDRLLITPALNTTSSTAAAALVNTDVSIEQLLHEYTTACTIFGCNNRINPGVLTTLRYQLPTLRVSGNFFDADMLALAEILLRHCNGALKYITRLDFSVAAKEGKSSSFGGGSGNGKRGFRSHGAYSLAKVLGMSEYIEEVYLMGNHVGPFGASAIFSSIGKNERSVLKTLLMRGCRIGERGALSFVSEVLEANDDDSTKNSKQEKKEIVLEEVDFSANRIGFHGCYEIERALKASSSTIVSASSASAVDTTTSYTPSCDDDAITTVWTPSG